MARKLSFAAWSRNGPVESESPPFSLGKVSDSLSLSLCPRSGGKRELISWECGDKRTRGSHFGPLKTAGS
ncbi:hypothetical protein CEXT_303071 [Caerostris extrusa]|uniref:Uncharacterized protein n=1 Tax=Caerostris extrusa TaxID=172846 RepID=A0AAV4MUN5_CAEEX|nr:hypothetical protein CEXT_303071 [Caerostris extrusa]